jgi:hypothetical protein
MDIPVATFILQKNQADLWIYPQLKHYKSSDAKKLFEKFTKVSLDPKLFFNLLSANKNLEKNWTCEAGAELVCKQEALNLDLRLEASAVDMRVIHASQAQKKLKIDLKRSQDQVSEKSFDFSGPPQFETIQL